MIYDSFKFVKGFYFISTFNFIYIIFKYLRIKSNIRVNFNKLFQVFLLDIRMYLTNMRISNK